MTQEAGSAPFLLVGRVVGGVPPRRRRGGGSPPHGGRGAWPPAWERATARGAERFGGALPLAAVSAPLGGLDMSPLRCVLRTELEGKRSQPASLLGVRDNFGRSKDKRVLLEDKNVFYFVLRARIICLPYVQKQGLKCL